MTSSRTSSRPRFLLGAAIVAVLFGAGCPKDPGPGKLFDEDGAWELVQYDLDGSGFMEINEPTADQAFLMDFQASKKVVQTAMCAELDIHHPGNTQCRLSTGEESFWFCQCYAYAFVEDQMQWRQFAPGEMPPKVEFTGDGGGEGTPTDDTATGGSGGSGGMVEPGGDTIINLIELPGVVGQIDFSPLPVGVWGSDGISSRYRMQQRTPSLFDQVFEDPEGRAGCQPCAP